MESKIVICKLLQFGRVKNLTFGKGINVYSSLPCNPFYQTLRSTRNDFQNFVEKGKMMVTSFFWFHRCFLPHHKKTHTNLATFSNPLPKMRILGFTNSAAKKDMMSKIWTNGDTIIWLSRKHCGKSNFSFSHNLFSSCLLMMRQNENLWSKGFLVCCSLSTKF